MEKTRKENRQVICQDCLTKFLRKETESFEVKEPINHLIILCKECKKKREKIKKS